MSFLSILFTLAICAAPGTVSSTQADIQRGVPDFLMSLHAGSICCLLSQCYTRLCAFCQTKSGSNWIQAPISGTEHLHFLVFFMELMGSLTEQVKMLQTT